MPYGGWMKLAVARRADITNDIMRGHRSHTLVCESNGRPEEKEFHAHLHSWRRFAISCAIYIAALIYPAFRFCGGGLTGALQSGGSCPGTDRGAALGALMRLEHPNASAERR